MNYKIVTIVLFAVSLLLFFATLQVYRSSIVFESEISAYLIVSEVSGFDVSPVFNFGSVRGGDSATRTANITNSYDFPIVVRAAPKGEIKRFVSFVVDEIEAGKSKEIAVSAVVPAGERLRNYTGSIKFTARRKLI
ncbi:MAG: hypothetical protein AABX65_01375 [Nanoarchaeota archaeon]